MIWGWIPGRGRGLSLLQKFTDWLLGPTQPPIKWVTRDFPPGIELVQPEADYIPLSSAETNIEWSCSSTPHIQLYVVLL
jgi:hypothetical protein